MKFLNNTLKIVSVTTLFVFSNYIIAAGERIPADANQVREVRSVENIVNNPAMFVDNNKTAMSSIKQGNKDKSEPMKTSSAVGFVIEPLQDSKHKVMKYKVSSAGTGEKNKS